MYHDPLTRVRSTKTSSKMDNEEQRYRLVALGSGQVGKSSVIMRLINGNFNDKYRETVEDLYTRHFDYNGNNIRLDILDTAGNFAFPAMRRLSISTAHAFLLVFSIDSLSSWQEVRELREQIKEQRDGWQDIPMVVIANKCDLESKRQVPQNEVEDWLESEDLRDSYTDASAKYNEGIHDAFKLLWDQAKITVVQFYRPPQIRKRRVSAFAVLQSSLPGSPKEDAKMNRSKSLMRRGSKAKINKNQTNGNIIDCILS